MNNIWARIRSILAGAWALICGVAMYSDNQVGRFINTCLIIIGIDIGLFILGYIAGIKGLTVFSGMISAIMVLIIMKSADLAVKIISAAIPKIPTVGSTATSITEPVLNELKKLLPPLTTISMVIAFLSAVTAIRGTGYYGLGDFMAWFSIILFLGILSVYLEKKTKMLGWVMLAFIIFLIVGDYAYPVQTKGTLDWIEGITIRRSVALSHNGMKNELATIPNNTPLYTQNFGGGFRLIGISPSTTVKILDRKDDPESKEGMYKVIIPTGNGIYIGGKTYFVPVRLAEHLRETPKIPLCQIQKQEKIVPQISYGWRVDIRGNLVADLKPGEEVTKVFRMSEGYSTPSLVLPPEGYRLRFDHLQTIIIEENGCRKKIVHPDDYYNMGVTQGQWRELKFTALKGGAEIITTLRRK